MKKMFLCIILLLLIMGCKSNKTEELRNEEEKKEVVTETYKDDNPIVVGIYQNDRELVHDYYTKKENNKDIIFSVFYTNDEVLESKNQKNNWYKYYNGYTNIDSYRIGFYISFYSEGKKIEKIIKEPKILDFAPYFYVYLYDDINQKDGVFYSHIEEGMMTTNTILSSIKLYLVKTEEITSPIELTVFTYDGEEDFDKNNKYRGNSKYTIRINLE